MRIVLVKLELREQNDLLRRIAEALERMYPPIAPAPEGGRKSDLGDLMVVDPRENEILKAVEEEFAKMWNVTPGSETFDKAREAFEADIRKERGQKGVDELPWNRRGKRR